MKQTKFESGIEVFMNYASGFVIAWSVYAFIVLPNEALQQSAFWVTVIYTIVSVVRSYLWRRFFNAGLHRAAHAIAVRVFSFSK